MTGDERHEFAQRFLFEVLEEMRFKGQEYQVNGDVNGNFKRVAEEQGDSVLKVWNTFVQKHIDGLNTYVRDPNRPVTEDIRGRITDIIAYMTILASLQDEGAVPLPPVAVRRTRYGGGDGGE